MRQLEVKVAGDHNEDRTLALPFDVYGPEGESLGQGTASPLNPKTIPLPPVADAIARVHVVALLPSGQRIQGSAKLKEGKTTVILSAAESSPHEWLQWVTPYRSLQHLSREGARLAEPPRRIGAVWMTLWRLNQGRWSATVLNPKKQMRDEGVYQIELKIPPAPHMLQIGGEEVSWRLISLPPGQPVRVAVTRRAGDEGDTVDVTIGRRHPVNDLVMAYLSSGATAEASRLAEIWRAADLALYRKMDDWVSAAAGGYVLLKIKRLDERRDWVRNLANWFPYMADGLILAAALEIQSAKPNSSAVRDYLEAAGARGLPVFAMGMSLMVETMAAVHRGKKESRQFHGIYQAARAYLHAQAPSGAYCSFYGRSPAEPDWSQVQGAAGNGVPITREPQQTLRRTTLRIDPASGLSRALSDALRLRGRVRMTGIDPTGEIFLIRDNLGAEREKNAFTVFDSNE